MNYDEFLHEDLIKNNPLLTQVGYDTAAITPANSTRRVVASSLGPSDFFSLTSPSSPGVTAAYPERVNKAINKGSHLTKDATMQVTIYTDGASRGNPGPGGYGTILHYADPNGKIHVKELSQGYKCTTNNRMELLAVIAGLEALKKPCSVTVYSDSQYVVNAFNQHWVEGWLKRGWKNAKKEPVKNSDLWKRLLAAKKNHNVTFKWVKGHAGHPENERCDELATTAADGSNLLVDERFKK